MIALAPAAAAAPTGGLVPSPTTLNLGTVPVGQIGEHDITVTNTSGSTLRIS